MSSIKPPRLSAKNKHLWANNKPFDEKEVMNWLKENCNWSGDIDLSNGKINVRISDDGNGSIGFESCFCNTETNFPYPFGIIDGSFLCNTAVLTSLKGSPKKVGGNFEISSCPNLTSLEGAPEEVGGDFYCIDCHNLISLEGAPKEVGDDFWCCNCGKEFTKSDVRKVCKVKGLIIT